MGAIDLRTDGSRNRRPRARRSFSRIALLAALMLAFPAAGGCQGGMGRFSGSSRIKTLHSAVLDYNKFLRWQEWEKASRFIRTAEQTDFKQGFYEIEEEFRITQYEIRDTNVDETESKSAEVAVLYHYYLLPSVTEKRARITQRWIWSEEEKRWAVEDPLGFLASLLEPKASRRAARTLASKGIESEP